MPHGSTMTLNECAEALRANQATLGEMTLGDGLVQKVFPFGYGIQCGKRRVFLIFRSRFYAWLDEMLMHEAIRIEYPYTTTGNRHAGTPAG